MRRIFLAASLVLAMGTLAWGQREELQDKANWNLERSFSERTRGKVIGVNRIQWAEGSKFWWVTDPGNGARRFFVGDAETKHKGDAFIEETMASALNAVGQKSGVESLEWKDGQMRVVASGKVYAWERETLTEISGEIRTTQPATTRATTQATTRRGRRSGGENSPDGKWRITHRQGNLVLIGENTEKILTTDGSTDADNMRYEGRIWWAPDSSRFVVMKVWPAQKHPVFMVESSPKDQKQPKLIEHDYLKPGDRVRVEKPALFDTAGTPIGIPDDLFKNPWSIGELEWQKDSSAFSFVFNERGHQTLRVIEVEAKTGIPRPLVEEKSPTFVCYSQKYFFQRLPDTSELIWMSERSGWNHLYLYDAKTATVKNPITSGEWVVRAVEKVDTEKREITFRASGVFPGQDPYLIHYGRVNFDGTGLTWLTRADGNHTVTFSPDGQWLTDTYSRVDLPAVTEIRRATDGEFVMEIGRQNADALLKTGWRYPEPFVAKARDGKTDIWGVIYRPTDFVEGKKYPVVEMIYAGPQDSFVPKTFAVSREVQRMAELGFITIQIDGMGTSNRSKAFHDVCYKNLADGGLPDRILWMKAAAAKYPEIDITRVGVYGGSAGGQNAASAVLRFGDFYKAAVADCGCHDNAMDKIWWNEQWMGWPVDASYDQNSNVTAAKNLKGRLMLTVGELDRNVDPASTMQVVDALIKADKDFDLIVFPGGGHGVGSDAYGRRKRLEFFVRWLM